MEQLIWQHDSLDGVDHGESCAAFASLTLELAAQVVGQQSWVTGGTSYPWPLHKWADVRVDPNPASPQIISVLQDAQAHHRWHPLGDGYRPLPGDWVLFNGHVEVVTKYADGVLSTIGGDSLPNFSVNAHEYSGSLAGDGVVGFVNNGSLTAADSGGPGGPARPDPGSGSGAGGQSGAGSSGGGQAAVRAQAGAGRRYPRQPCTAAARTAADTPRRWADGPRVRRRASRARPPSRAMPTAAGTASPTTPRAATRAQPTAARPRGQRGHSGVPALTPADEQRPRPGAGPRVRPGRGRRRRADRPA